MKPLGLAVFACGLLLAQQAGASSFAVFGAPPTGPSRSIIVIGEPAFEDSQVVLAPPDDTIRTAAFSGSGETPQDAVAALSSVRQEAADDWPPALSSSMVAYGEPSARPRPDADGGPAGLPMVIRGGLVGDAYPTTTARSEASPASIGAPRTEPTEKRAGRKPDAPAVAERRGSLPSDTPSGGDKAPDPATTPPAPAPPPPPTQRLE